MTAQTSTVKEELVIVCAIHTPTERYCVMNVLWSIVLGNVKHTSLHNINTIYTYANGTVSFTLVKKIPVGESIPMAFFSIGKSFVVIFVVRFFVK